MSQSDLALSVRGLGKEYRIARNRAEAHSTLAEAVLARARNPLRRAGHDAFWALRDVSFDVRKGDVVGVIGRNGAGKSTLLKVLSRITQPTTGEVKVWGRIGSLLEVGTGFHPELTGRENVFLNGSILGMTRPEIRREFDAIVAFAGVEKFLDTPVKRYSSGMYVRLAFAVAAHLRSDILIVDEVLAVGDEGFQKQCLRKMKDVAAGGRTVLFVSHNMGSVESLCDSAVFLHSGESVGPVPIREAVTLHAVQIRENAPSGLLSESLKRSRFIRKISVNRGGQHAVIRSGASLIVDIGLHNASQLRSVLATVVVNNTDGARIALLNSLYHSGVSLNSPEDGTLRCHIDSLPLTPGEYSLDVALGISDVEILEYHRGVVVLDVTFADLLGTGRLPSYKQGHVVLASSWSFDV